MNKLVEDYAVDLEMRVAERYAELLSRNAPVDTGALESSFVVDGVGSNLGVVGLYYGKLVDDNFVEISVEELELDIENGFI